MKPLRLPMPLAIVAILASAAPALAQEEMLALKREDDALAGQASRLNSTCDARSEEEKKLQEQYAPLRAAWDELAKETDAHNADVADHDARCAHGVLDATTHRRCEEEFRALLERANQQNARRERARPPIEELEKKMADVRAALDECASSLNAIEQKRAAMRARAKALVEDAHASAIAGLDALDREDAALAARQAESVRTAEAIAKEKETLRQTYASQIETFRHAMQERDALESEVRRHQSRCANRTDEACRSERSMLDRRRADLERRVVAAAAALEPLTTQAAALDAKLQAAQSAWSELQKQREALQARVTRPRS